MSELDIEGVLTSWFVNMSEGSVGGQYQRMRVGEVATILREQIAAWLGNLTAEWALTEFPDERTAETMRADLAALAAQVAPSRAPGEES